MNREFSYILDQYILVYLDNTLVYSETIKNHKKTTYLKYFNTCIDTSSRLNTKSVSCLYLDSLSWSHSLVWLALNRYKKSCCCQGLANAIIYMRYLVVFSIL